MSQKFLHYDSFEFEAIDSDCKIFVNHKEDGYKLLSEKELFVGSTKDSDIFIPASLKSIFFSIFLSHNTVHISYNDGIKIITKYNKIIIYVGLHKVIIKTFNKEVENNEKIENQEMLTAISTSQEGFSGLLSASIFMVSLFFFFLEPLEVIFFSNNHSLILYFAEFLSNKWTNYLLFYLYFWFTLNLRWIIINPFKSILYYLRSIGFSLIIYFTFDYIIKIMCFVMSLNYQLFSEITALIVFIFLISNNLSIISVTKKHKLVIISIIVTSVLIIIGTKSFSFGMHELWLPTFTKSSSPIDNESKLSKLIESDLQAIKKQ